MKTNWLKFLITSFFLAGATIALFLNAAGFRLSKDEDNQIDFTKTGMINAKSVPEGANVYVDGVLRTATDGTVAGIEPGFHQLGIVKNGFVTWNKSVEVFPELVTDITAVLISQSPRLEPLTNTGAKNPTISPTLSKLAFFSKDGTAPGVWVIPLTGEALNLFRSNPYVVLEDTSVNIYSNGKSIEWAPDETMLLVEDQSGNFYLVDLDTNSAIRATNPDVIREEWQTELLKKRADFVDNLNIPGDFRNIAMSPDTLWAPDEKKFLYKTTNGDAIEYRIYNMEKPIPVGENVETIALVTPTKEVQPKVSWYADSFHLILTEGDIENTQNGKISLLRIDGTNKIEVYSNTLYSDKVFSSPGGDKLVILTSFKSEGQTDLYTVGIR